jgi:hypothetical protein
MMGLVIFQIQFECLYYELSWIFESKQPVSRHALTCSNRMYEAIYHSDIIVDNNKG